MRAMVAAMDASGFLTHHLTTPDPDSDKYMGICRLPADHPEAHLHPRLPASFQRTLALTLAASILYIPANTMPRPSATPSCTAWARSIVMAWSASPWMLSTGQSSSSP